MDLVWLNLNTLFCELSNLFQKNVYDLSKNLAGLGRLVVILKDAMI
jgi:hypothetical protein